MYVLTLPADWLHGTRIFGICAAVFSFQIFAPRKQMRVTTTVSLGALQEVTTTRVLIIFPVSTATGDEGDLRCARPRRPAEPRGFVFGYASDETEDSVSLCHSMVKLTLARSSLRYARTVVRSLYDVTWKVTPAHCR